jgi:hypothetical protein
VAIAHCERSAGSHNPDSPAKAAPLVPGLIRW